MCFFTVLLQTQYAPEALNSSPQSAARAVAIVAGGEPPRTKSRRATVQPTPATQGSPVVNTNQSAALLSTASVEPQPISLSPGLLDQLVARVADKVARRLSPLDGTSTTSISRPVVPQCLVHQFHLQEWLEP